MFKKIISIFIIFFTISCQTQKDSKFNLGLLVLTLSNSNVQVKPPLYSAFANSVVAAPSQTGQGFKNANNAINGVRGGGCCSGSLDVYSLGASVDTNYIILEWKGKKVINGHGIDFVVYENPFQNGTNPNSVFMEQVIVEVSRDNVSYCGFSPKFNSLTPNVYSNNPNLWLRFAGRTPVLYNEDTNRLSEIELFDLSKAGGDGFDLEELSASNDFGIGCNQVLRDEIVTFGFIYLRLSGAAFRINPDTGTYFVKDSGSFDGVPDIDGAAARYLVDR
jgi:hypothetical protein